MNDYLLNALGLRPKFECGSVKFLLINYILQVDNTQPSVYSSRGSRTWSLYHVITPIVSGVSIISHILQRNLMKGISNN